MNLPERDFLSLLLNKDNWNQYGNYVDLTYIRETYKELFHVYRVLTDLHLATEGDLNLGDLETAFFVKHPSADKVLYGNLFKALAETNLSNDVGRHLLGEIKARKLALSLSERAFKFSNGTGELDKVTEAFDLFKTVEEQKGDQYVSVDTDLDRILDSAVREPGLRWRLDCFNKSLGSLRDGDFGFFFKRPESGGTAMMASEVSHMLDQVKRPIVWINNEEQDEKVILRVYQSYFGVDLATILANVGRYKKEFAERVGSKFQFFGHDYNNKKDIEGIIKQVNPQLVIYDQLDNVKGFAADRNDLMLGEIYKWARSAAKAGHAAIAVTQADGTAEGQKWLTMAHVSEAKTTKQATADFIIGMGFSFAEGMEYTRHLNICKNKLIGDADTLANLRHGRFDVIIQPEIMRFKDTVKYK